MTSTVGAWYPPSAGVGGFLLDGQLFTNPPFNVTTMSTQHPITPSPELVLALRDSAPHGIRDAGVSRELWLIDHAYAAGADMQLDVVLAKLTELHLHSCYADALRDLCRSEAPNDVINLPVLATHSTPQPPADGELTVNLRMDLSSECLERLCDGLAAAVKPNGGYRALTTDDDISGEFIGEQQVGVEWWLPEHGCDSLENTLDSIKGRLLAAVRDWLPIAVISTPQPPADGEVAASELVDLAHELRKASEYLRAGCGWNKAVEAIERAIELIEGGVLQRLAPVAVSERPWERDGWCDEQGRCWAWHPFDPENDETGDYWSRIPWHWIDDIGIWSHCLPASALPTPTTEDPNV
jgi:hypothetical protein